MFKQLSLPSAHAIAIKNNLLHHVNEFKKCLNLNKASSLIVAIDLQINSFFKNNLFYDQQSILEFWKNLQLKISSLKNHVDTQHFNEIHSQLNQCKEFMFAEHKIVTRIQTISQKLQRIENKCEEKIKAETSHFFDFLDGTSLAVNALTHQARISQHPYFILLNRLQDNISTICEDHTALIEQYGIEGFFTQLDAMLSDIQELQKFLKQTALIVPRTFIAECEKSPGQANRYQIEDWEIIYHPEFSGNNKYYAVSKESLGSGGSGVVYKAYPINFAKQHDNNPFIMATTDTSSPTAVKKDRAISFVEGLSLNEATLLNNKVFPQNTLLVNFSDDHYLFMPYVPSESIETLQNLPFHEKCQVFFKIAMAYNLVHNHTASTDKPVLHADVKLANLSIQLFPDNEKLTVEVYPLDFGTSFTMNEPMEFQEIEVCTWEYAAPEILDNRQGRIQSDIYSLAIAFYEILCGGSKLNQDEQAGQTYLSSFLGKMWNNDYSKRPEPDDVLRFFTSLNQLMHAYQIDKNENAALIERETLRLEFLTTEAEVILFDELEICHSNPTVLDALTEEKDILKNSLQLK